jgi:hypothetical protein
VAWTELTGDLPPWPPGDFRLAAVPVETLRLLKLHGSLNWYWRPGDSSGVSVARRDLPGWFGEPRPYDEEQRRRTLPGRTPFVVPPTASKSEYYANPLTREMWRQAAQRLHDARRVVFMGYSMPLTDVTFVNLFRDSVVNKDNSPDVVIADYSPAPVLDRLTALGVGPDRISVAPAGPGAIESVIEAWTNALSSAVLREVADNLSEGARMILAWGDRTAYAPVGRLQVEDEGVTAIADAVYSSFNGAIGINSRPAREVRDLMSAVTTLGPGPQFGLRASTSASGPSPVIAREVYGASTGEGSGEWLVLQVAGTPPDSRLP